MIGVALGVFALDALTVYLQVAERDAWATGSIRRSLFLEALTSAAIGVTVICIATYTWWMLAPSMLGSVAGRYVAWRW